MSKWQASISLKDYLNFMLKSAAFTEWVRAPDEIISISSFPRRGRRSIVIFPETSISIYLGLPKKYNKLKS